MLLKDILKLVPDGQWIVLTVVLTKETYGFYYRRELEQIPIEYYDSIAYLIRASTNNCLEVCI